ncbi:MAG TPA: helix-turn-helix domain-containing protein [Gemmatimonadaceae bacterium]|jgi:transcriptional regulator GlxA family with amidase domain|nr:helix-turn-helix domain-containing protein [Gemmatimonadaceae bacterium]
MTAHPRLIDVLFVIVPHSLMLDVAGPAEAFRLANQHRGNRGLPPRFRLRFAAPNATQDTSVGLSICGLEPLPRELAANTWVVVVGQPTEHLGKVTADVTRTARWLQRSLGDALREDAQRDAAQRDGAPTHRLVTICSGTLLAARAGVLGARRCTTHHELLHTLRVLAPRAEVIENRVFVVDGPLASSAGITAGIDVALHLIGEECGEALAASVAEDMVVYLRRSDRDPEQSPFRVHRGHLHQTVHRVQDAIIDAPDRDWNMAALARAGHTTERHLLRLFLEHAHVSPLQYLQSIRLERARQALEHGASVTQAAAAAGFRSDLQMRRAWGKQWGGSPRDVLKSRAH